MKNKQANHKEGPGETRAYFFVLKGVLLVAILGFFIFLARYNQAKQHASLVPLDTSVTVCTTHLPDWSYYLGSDVFHVGEDNIQPIELSHATIRSKLKTDSTEILWLARALYTESDIPKEQYYIAWVIRNRVDTSFRGKSTYQDVILDPFQFSAFNSAHRRYYYSKMSENNPPRRIENWKSALEIAEKVYYAREYERPIPIKARHFYAQISMKNKTHPLWADRKKILDLPGINPYRLRILKNVDSNA